MVRVSSSCDPDSFSVKSDAPSWITLPYSASEQKIGDVTDFFQDELKSSDLKYFDFCVNALTECNLVDETGVVLSDSNIRMESHMS